MQIRKVCVLGGSGFVGSTLVHQLSAAGYEVTALVRRREASKHLILLPTVQVVECNIFDDAALGAQLAGHDAVINLIGILHEQKKATFTSLHAELPQRLARLSLQHGIRRVLHVSALQAAENAPSAYLRSKAAGEAALLAYGDQLQLTIFRPSVVFGRNDRFLNLFATLIKLSPWIPLAKPAARFQPVFVEDVAQAIVSSLENSDTFGKIYELAGPRVYTLRELVETVATIMGRKPRIIGLNDTLSLLQGTVLGLLPFKLMSRDNVRSMQVDNVSEEDFPAVFGFEPTPLDAVIPSYLADQTPRGEYDRYRGYAGR